MSENFVFVDLDNYEIAKIHSRIMKFVEERKKITFKYFTHDIE